MKTTTVSIFATFAFAVLLNSPTANADHHHRTAWWTFLIGTWTYEDSFGKGEVTYKMAPTGEALVGEWRNADGTTALEVAGWQADKKIQVVTGYNSVGGYWHIEFGKITETACEGPDHGRNRDGVVYDGKIVSTRTDENHWQWDFVGKDGEGNELKWGGKLTRK